MDADDHAVQCGVGVLFVAVALLASGSAEAQTCFTMQAEMMPQLFQPLVNGTTPWGPGEPEYLGGRWWVGEVPGRLAIGGGPVIGLSDVELQQSLDLSTVALPGLVLAAGFSGHGFGIGPGAGHLIADIVSDMPPLVDPRPYHPDRFRSSAWGKVAEF